MSPLFVAALGLGAREVVISTDAEQMQQHAGTFDFIVDTVGADHDITADVEVVPIQNVNEAYERMLSSDVKHRFSIDMSSLKAE